ncbi:hypothetical protein GGS24DRAFT_281745 [Hypoxylon argillaceum]|nr:hypothetical protein GGS24DRAFT_281745 [Hypoxylon argillaceum]
MSDSSNAVDLSMFPNTNDFIPAPNSGEAPSSSPGIPSESHGFARPPPDFDPSQGAALFSAVQARDLSNPARGVEESVEDEVKRKIAELEEARGRPVTGEEKERIAKRIRSLREGGWLEGLKRQLIGQKTVPMEYFNRLVAEHENTIAIVAQINATADRKVTEKDAVIENLKNGGGRNPDNDPVLLENKLLQYEKTDLKDQLGESEKDKTELQDQLQKLNDELQQEKSKSQGNNEVGNALAECNQRANDLQQQLDTARETSSRYYNEAQDLQQQKAEAVTREQVNKDEIRRLREETKIFSDAIASGKIASDNLQKRISDLEAECVNGNAKVKAQEEEIEKLKNVAALGGPADAEGLRKRTQELEVELAKRDDTITSLKAQLVQARNPPASSQSEATPQESNAQLQARCAELRAQSDMYRDKWARGVVAGNAPLVEFWQTVDNTKKEINRLYVGVEKLCRALGIADGVLDIPETLDRIVNQVTGSSSDLVDTPLITILNLRTANSLAQIQIETLQRQLDRAQLGKTEDEIKGDLRLVDEEELERRVTLRTQMYRQYRGTLLTHIFEAQFAFLSLADKSADRDAIEALVEQFLEPTSLPMIQLPTNRTRRED